MSMRKGFTLIELMIVVAIIAVIAAIAIPALLSARKSANKRAALATVRNFGSAALSFATSNPAQTYWDNTNVNFSPHFAHVALKSGYHFKYFSDDNDEPEYHEGQKFVYLAYPRSMANGDTAYYIDEAYTIWEAKITHDIISWILDIFRTEWITWSAEAGRLNRISIFKPIDNQGSLSEF